MSRNFLSEEGSSVGRAFGAECEVWITCGRWSRSLPQHLTSIQPLIPGCSGAPEAACAAWSKAAVKFSETLQPADVTLVAWSGHGWEYLHHCCCRLITQSCLTLCDPRDWSRPGFPVLHHLPELAQTHVLWVSDAIQPSYPLSSPSPPAFSLSQHQGLFQWVSSSHQVTKVLELQLQHQSFQWIFRTDFL